MAHQAEGATQEERKTLFLQQSMAHIFELRATQTAFKVLKADHKTP